MEGIYSMIKDALCADLRDYEIYEYESYDLDGKLDKEATEKVRADLMAQRERGREILKKYRLCFSKRRVTPILQRSDSIITEAGYVATSPAYREVWLEPR